MPRITKVYTRTGDDGTTALGSGQRVPKCDLRIAAGGTVDELNSHIGAILAAGPVPEFADPLREIQNDLFHLGADLSISETAADRRPGPRIEARHVERLERLLDTLNAQVPPLKNFVLPGGSAVAAQLQVARAVCRRAEREVVALAQQQPVGPHIVPYLNRLSDALFVLARVQNQRDGVSEPLWDSRA